MNELKPISQDQWVIVRWNNGFRCGPLSRVTEGLGYHEGHVGVLAIFDTHTEASACAEAYDVEGVCHTAVRLKDLKFNLRRKHESTISVIGDYQTVLQAFALATLTYPNTKFIIEEVVGSRPSLNKLRAVT